MATILSFLSGRQITDDNGNPASGALVYHYKATTTNDLTVYQESGAITPHAQPVPCDAGGFVPLVYVTDLFNWKVVIKTAGGVTLHTYDNLPAAPAAASSTGFAPPLLSWNQVTSAASPVNLAAADAGKAYEADTTSGSITFNLPSAASVGNGRGFVFKKTASANSLIIDPSGTETTDDSATAITITRQYQVIAIFSNGAEWYIAWSYFDDVPISVGAANSLTIGNNAGTPTTQLDVACSEAVLVHTTSNYAIRVGSQALTLNAANVGANGIDAGSLANNTWYYVYLISNGTTTALLLSTSATAPTMPSGYIYKYRIGTQRTGGSATFLRIRQLGNRAQYVVVAASTTPNYPILQTGTTGSSTVPTYTTLSLANFIPPTATAVRGSGRTGGAAGVVLVNSNAATGATGSATNPPILDNATGTGQNLTAPFDIDLETQNLFVAITTLGQVFIYGWTDAVNAN